MRRWLAALLLAFLSVQLSWAAVAPYCLHEAAPSGHFGHHAHQHQAQHQDLHADSNQHPAASAHDAGDADGSSKIGKSVLTIDQDCNQCHGNCVGLAQVLLPALAPIPMAHPGAAAAAGSPAGGFERPERPKWLHLA